MWARKDRRLEKIELDLLIQSGPFWGSKWIKAYQSWMAFFLLILSQSNIGKEGKDRSNTEEDHPV